MMAVRRMSMLTHAPADQKLSSRAQQLAKDLNRYMEDSEQVSVSVTPLPLSSPCTAFRALLPSHYLTSLLYTTYTNIPLITQEHIDEDKSLVHHHGAEEDSDTSSSHNSHSTPPTSPDLIPKVPAKADPASPLAAQFQRTSLKD